MTMEKAGRYYIYAHVSCEGYYLYIGTGTNNQAYQNHQYIERIDAFYEVRMIAQDLTEMEAMTIEKALVRLHQPFCTSKEVTVFASEKKKGITNYTTNFK